MFEKVYDVGRCTRCGVGNRDLYHYNVYVWCKKCIEDHMYSEYNPNDELTIAQWAESHRVTHEPPSGETERVVPRSSWKISAPQCDCCCGPMLDVNYFDPLRMAVRVGFACLSPQCKRPLFWAMDASESYGGGWRSYAERSTEEMYDE